MRAILASEPDLVGQCLEAGANPNLSERRPTQRSPLHLALCVRSTEHRTAEFTLLLKHGASVVQETSAGDTPLHLAASRGDLSSVEVLIAHRADANTETRDGLTPLDVARANSHRHVAQYLRGVTRRSSRQRATQLQAVVRSGDATSAKEAIAAGARINAAQSLLHAAGANASMVSLLIELGASIEHRGDRDTVPVASALIDRHTTIVDLLAKKGALLCNLVDSISVAYNDAKAFGHTSALSRLFALAELRAIQNSSSAHSELGLPKRVFDRINDWLGSRPQLADKPRWKSITPDVDGNYRRNETD